MQTRKAKLKIPKVSMKWEIMMSVNQKLLPDNIQTEKTSILTIMADKYWYPETTENFYMLNTDS